MFTGLVSRPGENLTQPAHLAAQPDAQHQTRARLHFRQDLFFKLRHQRLPMQVAETDDHHVVTAGQFFAHFAQQRLRIITVS